MVRYSYHERSTGATLSGSLAIRRTYRREFNNAIPFAASECELLGMGPSFDSVFRCERFLTTGELFVED